MGWLAGSKFFHEHKGGGVAAGTAPGWFYCRGIHTTEAFRTLASALLGLKLVMLIMMAGLPFFLMCMPIARYLSPSHSHTSTFLSRSWQTNLGMPKTTPIATNWSFLFLLFLFSLLCCHDTLLRAANSKQYGCGTSTKLVCNWTTATTTFIAIVPTLSWCTTPVIFDTQLPAVTGAIQPHVRPAERCSTSAMPFHFASLSRPFRTRT